MEADDRGRFAYELHREGARAVVALRGELDMASAPLLAECLEGLRANRIMHVTVDLAALDFCDSSGLSTFLRFRREADGQSSSLILRSPRPGVQRLFALTKTDALLVGDGRRSPTSAH